MSLVLHGVNFSYNKRSCGLVDVDLNVGPGMTAILGANGAGKSTLLRVLATELRCYSGKIFFDGTQLSKSTIRDYRKLSGWVPQSEMIQPDETPFQFVSKVAWLRGLSGKRLEHASHAALERVSLSDEADIKSKELSGGMKRRAAIAAGIVHNPTYLLLDEPTAGLDPTLREGHIKQLRGLADDGVHVLFSTHVPTDLEEADYLIVMASGSVILHAPTEELKQEHGSIQNAYRQFF
ncbi:ABC transporter ATP-binding protein [Corynebacterium hesseae]|uniref:ABC transporter ATP-binding protein n=1 Tax=Corynebacterium hesseae TaxID=2913502 RepID=UPI0022BA02B1|nr:ABC transporter ATP-binding protein [Corynebacterium hesseae]